MQTYVPAVQKLVVGAAVALTLSLTPLVAPELGAQARRQGQGQMANPEQRTEQRVKQLTRALDLTPQQVEQVGVILKEQAAAQLAMRGKMESGDRAAARQQMLSLRETYEAKILALLSDEQKPLFAKLAEQDRARRPGAGAR